MEILFVTSEVTPFHRRTVVGDICAALPKALRGLGHQVTVIAPLWPDIDPSQHALARRLRTVAANLGDAQLELTVHDGRTTGGVETIFVGNDELFGNATPDAHAWQRAALAFCCGVAEIAAGLERKPEVVHTHDAFAAAALPLCAAKLPESLRVLSIHATDHDASQHGRLQPGDSSLPAALATSPSLLAAGAAAAQHVVTSTRFAARALGAAPDAGGLGDLVAPEGKLATIANGIDAARWNPLTDALLPVRFDPVDLSGKDRCKDALQYDHRLEIRPETTLIFAASGHATLASTADALLRNDAQLLVLDGGDSEGSEALRTLAHERPEQVAIAAADDERLLHRALAGADAVLLGDYDAELGDLHLCAQRYGTLPLAPRDSVFADALVDCEPSLKTGSAFLYGRGSGPELLAASQRLVSAQKKSEALLALRRRLMLTDVTWERGARHYEHLYRSSTAGA
ncbi:MAG: glycogen/starch synthase [Myxococcales bacterium]|nr:glycogen/starch synthase [Myxococcales bacterium]